MFVSRSLARVLVFHSSLPPTLPFSPSPSPSLSPPSSLSPPPSSFLSLRKATAMTSAIAFPYHARNITHVTNKLNCYDVWRNFRSTGTVIMPDYWKLSQDSTRGVRIITRNRVIVLLRRPRRRSLHQKSWSLRPFSHIVLEQNIRDLIPFRNVSS